MLFHVEMHVRLPASLSAGLIKRLKKEERLMAQALQHSGKWRHLWRLVGCYANISIFDVEGPAELHDILTSLPLFPFMEIITRALCQHPSAISVDEVRPRKH